MENGKNGRPRRELRSHPGEAWLQCEFCQDFFHHNGLGMHRHYCALRDPDERLAYANRKHTLQLPSTNNTVSKIIPVDVSFFHDRAQERLHVRVSVTDSTLIELGHEAEDMGLIRLPKVDDD